MAYFGSIFFANRGGGGGQIIFIRTPSENRSESGGRGCLADGRLGFFQPSLGAQVLTIFSFISKQKAQFKQCLAKRLEVLVQTSAAF